jgi:membrane protein DedA with SNARE-associated domain
MASLIELIGVLVGSFLVNLIPFAGPSNLFIASTAALSVTADPFTIGFLVALGATMAKSIHYIVTFFVGKHIGEKRRRAIDANALKIKRWAFPLLYIAAATPIPDEPVVIPLGLMKYNPAKFFTAYFLGKVTITIIGAFLGTWTEHVLSPLLSREAMIVLSVILTILIAVILLKVDIGKIIERIFKRKNTPTQTEEKERANVPQ